MRGSLSFSFDARALINLAAPLGLAAPKLPTMTILCFKQSERMGSNSSSKRGSNPKSGRALLVNWCAARVRSARFSKMIAEGKPLSIRVLTTGAAASVLSPEKPAPQPTKNDFIINVAPRARGVFHARVFRPVPHALVRVAPLHGNLPLMELCRPRGTLPNRGAAHHTEQNKLAFRKPYIFRKSSPNFASLQWERKHRSEGHRKEQTHQR